MRKFLFSVCILFALSSSAQFLEFGGSLGVSSYAGDLRRGYNLADPSLGISPFARFNMSEIVSVRLGLLISQLQGTEKPIDVLGVQRNQEFKSSLIELSAIFEYHFLDYKTENSRFKYSPYLFAGFGVMNYPGIEVPDENVGSLQPVFPIGGGIKYLFKKRYSLGLELGARKTFFDYLDNISDGDQFIKDYQYGNPNDDDWYFFTAFSFSVILFDIPCPYPYTPNKSILSR